MKTLITGGNGFIAQNLKLHLEIKYPHNVVAPSHEELDICDCKAVYEYLKKYKINVIVHTANYDAINQYKNNVKNKTVEINLRMFFNLVKHRALYEKLICLGTGAEYGLDNIHSHKWKEDDFDIDIPKNEYGFSKYIMSKYAESVDFITVLRLFGVYGGHDDWKTKFISRSCCRVLSGIPIEIYKDRLMDYIHVKDLCKIIDFFINNDIEHKHYNVCSGESKKLSDIATYIQKCNTNAIINTMELTQPLITNIGYTPLYTGSITRLRKEYKKVFIHLRTGIKNLYEWYKKNPHEYNKEFIIHEWEQSNGSDSKRTE